MGKGKVVISAEAEDELQKTAKQRDKRVPLEERISATFALGGTAVSGTVLEQIIHSDNAAEVLPDPLSIAAFRIFFVKRVGRIGRIGTDSCN